MRILIFFTLLTIVSAFCPCIDRSKLGHSTWYLLHEIAKQPPSPYFNTFMESLSYIYPCTVCRKHLKKNLMLYPLYQNKISMCKFHNEINYQLNKSLYNCSLV